MYKEDYKCSLMAETIKLLRKDKRSLLQIHKETNINFFWLRKFAAGEFKNPSVNRVQFLYEFLSGSSITL